ncbi:metallophosphoesterase family protein [Amniculibacterium sp. G2-70]|uniref:metallophosphoesterase family protein n=1 Tax=Amniculibacterium sp. G2-70 TaxID=2767188 RepID=UPI00165422A7|nr:metallophosphoesterase [Amniculibacterium sp. G2-70]
MITFTILLIFIALGFLIPHALEIFIPKNAKQITIFRDHEQKYPYYFSPQKPVHWFDFQGLINTFRRVSLSSDILSVIDKREVQANFGKDNFNEIFDKRSHPDEYWLDFIADTGDGFDTTTSVFYHLTRSHFSKNLGVNLKPGDALVIGGDLVYPDGSDKNYGDRFKGPIRFIFPSKSRESAPYLLAVPGNHDWYDGLTAFYRMMAQQNIIGNYKTIQNRSYFAYHLGFNHHLFGLDNQLKGDLDLPQMEYFKKYIENLCKIGSTHHIILLVAEPYWYAFEAKDFKKRRQRMDSIDYFVKVMRTVINNNKAYDTEVEFDIVITGDIHHYSHYELRSPNHKTDVKHYIASGGGGAFGHVTGFLKEEIILPKLGNSTTEYIPYDLKKRYPSKEVSDKFIGYNLLFFIKNYKFTSLILFFSLIAIYIHSFTDNIAIEIISIFMVPAILTLTVVQVANPEPSDLERRHNKILYASLFIVCSVVSSIFHLNLFDTDFILPDCNPKFGLFIIQWVIPALIQAFLMGVYFYLSYRFYGLHVTEISSGKIQEGYRNFIKFKITKDEITLYVFGIKEQYQWLNLIKKNNPKDLQKQMSEETTFDENGHDTFLKKHFNNYKDNLKLIETIKIKHHETTSPTQQS